MTSVVTPDEMGRLESIAFQQGVSTQDLVEQAGQNVADTVLAFLRNARGKLRVFVVAGKGNNGADAYAAAHLLLQQGVPLAIFSLYQEEMCSSLNVTFRNRLHDTAVEWIEDIQGWLEFSSDVIIDGFLGTGFRGDIEPRMAFWIEQINQANQPIFAIDIPSGLDAQTGQVASIAIQAHTTIAIGWPKVGLFLEQGWNHVGKIVLTPLDFSFEKICSAAFLIDEATLGLTIELAQGALRLELPKIVRKRHKYEAGYVLGAAGSFQFSGSAYLSSFAALRSGAGLVRIFSYGGPLQGAPEVIFEAWDHAVWKEHLLKASACLIGPGVGDDRETRSWIEFILKDLALPSVVDADALQYGLHIPSCAILTPHRKEACRLVDLPQATCDSVLIASLQRLLVSPKQVIVLKGAPTWVLCYGEVPYIVPFGDPGMATAGSGDVLAGILAALLAQGMSTKEAALLGVAIHGLAGEYAATLKTSYCMVASDLIEALPSIFARLAQQQSTR